MEQDQAESGAPKPRGTLGQKPAPLGWIFVVAVSTNPEGSRVPTVLPSGFSPSVEGSMTSVDGHAFMLHVKRQIGQVQPGGYGLEGDHRIRTTTGLSAFGAKRTFLLSAPPALPGA